MSSNFVAGASDKRDRVANLTALEKAQLHAFVLFRASLNGGNGTAQMVEQFFQLHPSVGRGPLLPGGDSISGRQKAPAAPPTSVPLDQAHSAVPQQSVQRGPIPPFLVVAHSILFPQNLTGNPFALFLHLQGLLYPPGTLAQQVPKLVELAMLTPEQLGVLHDVKRFQITPAVSQTSTALAPRSIQPIPISLLHDPTHLASVAAKLRSRIAYLELLKTSRAPEITEEHRASVLFSLAEAKQGLVMVLQAAGGFTLPVDAGSASQANSPSLRTSTSSTPPEGSVASSSSPSTGPSILAAMASSPATSPSLSARSNLSPPLPSKRPALSALPNIRPSKAAKLVASTKKQLAGAARQATALDPTSVASSSLPPSFQLDSSVPPVDQLADAPTSIVLRDTPTPPTALASIPESKGKLVGPHLEPEEPPALPLAEGHSAPAPAPMPAGLRGAVDAYAKRSGENHSVEEGPAAARGVSMRAFVEKIGSGATMTDEAEMLLLQICDEFIDSITRAACQLALHRAPQEHEARVPGPLASPREAVRNQGFAPTTIKASDRFKGRRQLPAGYKSRLDAVQKEDRQAKDAAGR